MSTQGFSVGGSAQDPKAAESVGVWLELFGLDEEPLTYQTPNAEGPPTVRPVRILVAGTYSTQYLAAFDRSRQKMLAKRRAKMTSQQIREQQRELAAACCINWEGFFLNSAVYPCSAPNAERLFETAPHIQEQVEGQMLDHASFFKTASGS